MNTAQMFRGGLSSLSRKNSHKTSLSTLILTIFLLLLAFTACDDGNNSSPPSPPPSPYQGNWFNRPSLGGARTFTNISVASGESETWDIIDDTTLTIEHSKQGDSYEAKFSYTHDVNGLYLKLISCKEKDTGNPINLSNFDDKLVFAYTVTVTSNMLMLTPRLSKTTVPDIMYEAAGSFISGDEDKKIVYGTCCLSQYDKDHGWDDWEVISITNNEFVAKDDEGNTFPFTYSVSGSRITISREGQSETLRFDNRDRTVLKP